MRSSPCNLARALQFCQMTGKLHLCGGGKATHLPRHDDTLKFASDHALFSEYHIIYALWVFRILPKYQSQVGFVVPFPPRR